MGVIVWLTSLKMIKCLFFVLVEVNSPSTVYSSDNPWRLGSLVHEKWNFTDPFLSYHLRFGCKCLEYEIEFDTNLIVSFYLFFAVNISLFTITTTRKFITPISSSKIGSYWLHGKIICLFLCCCYIFVYTLYQTKNTL